MATRHIITLRGFNLDLIVPSSVNQPTAGRRRRFRAALEELVAPHGWEPPGLTSLRKRPSTPAGGNVSTQGE